MQKRTKFQIRSDAAKQRWVRDDKKEAFWRKHVEAWKKSGLSKRAYCITNNLSQSSFNAWWRELEIRDRERIPSENALALLAEPSDEPKTAKKAAPKTFLPLHVLPEPAEPDSSRPSSKMNSGGPTVELILPGGCVIHLSQDTDLKLIGKLLSSLEARQC